MFVKKIVFHFTKLKRVVFDVAVEELKEQSNINLKGNEREATITFDDDDDVDLSEISEAVHTVIEKLDEIIQDEEEIEI